MGSQLTFVNSVAERIEKVHHNVKVGTLAYWYTRKPPKTIKPRHNVQIQLCSIECCTLHAIDNPDCEQNQAFCADTNEWGKICNDTGFGITTPISVPTIYRFLIYAVLDRMFATFYGTMPKVYYAGKRKWIDG